HIKSSLIWPIGFLWCQRPRHLLPNFDSECIKRHPGAHIALFEPWNEPDADHGCTGGAEFVPVRVGKMQERAGVLLRRYRPWQHAPHKPSSASQCLSCCPASTLHSLPVSIAWIRMKSCWN